MPKDDRLYFGHMLDAARKVVEKTRGIERDMPRHDMLALPHFW